MTTWRIGSLFGAVHVWCGIPSTMHGPGSYRKYIARYRPAGIVGAGSGTVPIGCGGIGTPAAPSGNVAGGGTARAFDSPGTYVFAPYVLSKNHVAMVPPYNRPVIVMNADGR
jgi:hypothetical protein